MEPKVKKNENHERTMDAVDDTVHAAQDVLHRGVEAISQAERAVSDVYDITAHKVSEKYAQARKYSSENPGRTILIAFGAGVGLGVILGSSNHGPRSRRIARPVVNTLSEIALEFFR